MSPSHQRVVPLRAPVPVDSVQGTLALDLQPRQDPPEVTRATGRHNGAAGDVIPIDLAERRQIEQWSRRYAQAAVEIVGGDRPVYSCCAGRAATCTPTCSAAPCSSPVPASTCPVRGASSRSAPR